MAELHRAGGTGNNPLLSLLSHPKFRGLATNYYHHEKSGMMKTLPSGAR